MIMKSLILTTVLNRLSEILCNIECLGQGHSQTMSCFDVTSFKNNPSGNKLYNFTFSILLPECPSTKFKFTSRKINLMLRRDQSVSDSSTSSQIVAD